MNRAELVRELAARRSGVRLRVIAVEDLTDVSQRFRCEPYQATLRASTCVARQGFHGKRVRSNGYGKPCRMADDDERQATFIANFGKCGNCELGRRVVEQVAP